MCKSLQTDTQCTQIWHNFMIKHLAFDKIHLHRHTHVEQQQKCCGCLDTHHVQHHILHIPRSGKSQSTTPSGSYITVRLFFFSHQVICCLLASARLALIHSHTPLWHAERSCRLLLSPFLTQTEWEEFTLAFFFF